MATEVLPIPDMCPRCKSSKLKIKQLTGFERIRALFTGDRTYRCRDCDFGFRSRDRRALSREPEVEAAAGRVDGILR